MNSKFFNVVSKIKYLAVLMFLTIVSTHTWGADQTVTWTATSGALGTTGATNNQPQSGTIKTNSYNWNYTRTLYSGSQYAPTWIGGSTNIIQLGKNGCVENITFTTSNIPGTIKSVSVYCASYQGKHKVAITVGETTYLASTATPTWSNNAGNTKTGTGTSSGTITISITGGSRALYIKSISVTYNNDAPSCTTTPTVGSALSSVSATTNSITATIPISAIGGCNITENGLVYSTTNSTPTVGGSGCTKVTTTACGSTAANKTVTISGLTCGTTYYVRGYATNAAGTSYTNTKTQSTSACPKYTVTLKDDDTELAQASAGASVDLPTRAGCAGYTFAGWTKSWATAKTTWTTTAPTIIPAGSYTPTANENLYPVYTKTEGGGGTSEETASVTISDYATTNSWEDATKYTSATIDANVTATATGGGNTGKYYNSGSNWRFYQNESAKVTISTTSGTLKSVKFTFTVSSNGTLNYNSSALTSGTAVNVSGTSAEFTVGNSSSATNGQVRITAIEVVYEVTGGSTTSYISVPNCCSALGAINGSVIFIYQCFMGVINYTPSI